MELTAYRAIEANRLRAKLLTALTAALLTAFFGASVWIIGPENARNISPFVILVGTGVFNAREVWLTLLRARSLDKSEAPMLYHRLDTLSVAFGLRTPPTVYVMAGARPNALALERVGKNGALVVTKPLLALKADALDAVLAHELSHLTSAFIGLRALTAFMTGLAAAVLSTRSIVHRAAAVLLFLLAVVLIGPATISFAALLAAFLLADARISREREHMADAQAILVTRFPKALADVLRETGAAASAHERERLLSDAELLADPLWTIRPRRPSDLVARVLDWHPSTAERIRRIEQMS